MSDSFFYYKCARYQKPGKSYFSRLAIFLRVKFFLMYTCERTGGLQEQL